MIAVSGAAGGIVTLYSFEGPRIELCCGQDFPQLPRPAADLYHIVVHYNCSNKQHKRIPAAVQTGSKSIS